MGQCGGGWSRMEPLDGLSVALVNPAAGNAVVCSVLRGHVFSCLLVASLGVELQGPMGVPCVSF